MILIDSHVHIHDCFDLHVFLDSALANFINQATRYNEEKNFITVLLLTESERENRFQYLVNCARKGYVIGADTPSQWIFYLTDENCSLQAKHNGNYNLFVVAGRQIITEEKLEVLALATDNHFKDGKPIKQVIQSIHDQGAVPVIPYGFGKWFGRRGLILRDLIEKTKNPRFFLGDNGGRPNFFPRPSHFKQAEKQGIRILPGSDPLPFTSECRRAGSFGFSVNGLISSKHPAEELKHILLDPNKTLQRYGRLEKAPRFIINQLAMQFIKQRRNKKDNKL
jgi:hypothetical protein